ncbi:uncharacterized protein LOC112595262 [Melanaphis sacchari]|uniref:uncharacterized protein LOC112595262 n=1 Tax=Melanaphis sacchari TaxID=742174 RepID=UPI000DC1352C|nr:uncharacterized protein LOC112595262 [Melanaphis sacchari]
MYGLHGYNICTLEVYLHCQRVAVFSLTSNDHLKRNKRFKMMGRIQNRHQSEFKRRLKLVQPALNRIMSLLYRSCLSPEKLVSSQIYISGKCAAWLVGRADEFNVFDIFVMGYNPEDFSFSGFSESSDRFTAKYTRIIEIQTDGTDFSPPITLIFSDFDFSAVSVFVNLFNHELIYTYDCPCDYGRCTVTNNGCLEHGEVNYPQLFDLSPDEDRLEAFPELKLRNQQRLCNNPHNRDKYVSLMAFEPSRENEYSKRLFPKNLTTSKPRDLTVSFCEYKKVCGLCSRSNYLAAKYFGSWKLKTFPMPHGYGNKTVLDRNNADMVSYCTCKNIPSA